MLMFVNDRYSFFSLKRKFMILVKKKLCKTKKKETSPNEKPEIIKTHLRNMIIILEMIQL